RCDFNQTAHIKDTVHEPPPATPKDRSLWPGGASRESWAASALMPISITLHGVRSHLADGRRAGDQPDVLPPRAQEAAVRPESACLSGAFFVWRNRKQGMLQSWE